MKYILLSVLVVLVAIMAVPDAFAATYTDPNNKFSIEYPSGWLKEITNSEEGNVRFTDKYNWNADIQVFNYDLRFADYRGMSDSSILEELKEQERDQCNRSTYQDHTFVCYNYQVVSADYFLTEQNKTAYFVNSIYTKQYEGVSGEQHMQSTITRVIDGAYHWEISSEIKKAYVDRYFDMLLRNALSFKLLQGQGVSNSNVALELHIDNDNKFSIQYPSGWIRTDSEDWNLVEFQDMLDWNSWVRVELAEDLYYTGTGDTNILREIKDFERGFCNDSSYAVDEFICYNYKLNDASVVYTNENRKAYFIDQTYTKNLSTPDYPGEYSMRSIVLEVHDGNDAWIISTESVSSYVGIHLDPLIASLYSFKLLQGQSTTPPPAPTYEDPLLSYWGSIVEFDKVYYKQNDVVNFLVVTPSFNANPNVVESIGTDVNSRVTISTSQGTLDFYKLKETGVDTGVFEGSISLNSINTSGTGPWSGNIKTSNKDTITVQFSNTYSGNVDTVKAQGFVEGPSVTAPTPTPTPMPSAESSVSIPAWIKSNAGWWVDGTIDDGTFVSGIQYLVQVGIIQVG